MLPLGTVLATDAAPYDVIFHAGFHHPDIWLSPEDSDDNAAEHVRIIGDCVAQVLKEVEQRAIGSVAFPLIGCGLFALDPGLMAHEFFAKVWSSTLVRIDRATDVWLVINDVREIRNVVEAGVQAWIPSISEPAPAIELGIPFLDLFATHVAQTEHPQWRAWLVARYAEIVVAYFCARLSGAFKPPVGPPSLLKPDFPPSFGSIRGGAANFAKALGPNAADGWTHFLCRLMEIDDKAGRLTQINSDRNNIAHGRKFRAAEEMETDLRSFLRLTEWLQNSQGEPLAMIERLRPWIEVTSLKQREIAEAEKVGVLDRWNESKWTYVLPITGERFHLPRRNPKEPSASK